MAWTIVTGGSGFIGLNLVERLLSEGVDVLVLDSRPLPARALHEFGQLDGQLTVRICDIGDAAALAEAVREPVDRILHAAAITPDASREAAEAERIVAVNVGGAANMARLAQRLGVPRVAFIGTAAIYGQSLSAGPDPITETASPSPTTLYGATKYAAELVMRRLADLYGFSLVICRLGWVFGPWEQASGVRDTLSPLFQLTSAMAKRRSVSLPRPDRRGWTYSRDAAATIVSLLRANSSLHGTYHVASGQRIDLVAWAHRLEAAFPGSACRIADPAADVTVELFAAADGPLFTSEWLAGELELPWRGEEEAFRDYCDWLEAAPWPIRKDAEGDRP